MKSKDIRAAAGVLFTALAIVACSSIATAARLEQLNRSVNAYNGMIRWGEYEKAAGFLDAGAPQATDMDALAHIRVTSYELKGSAFSGDEKTAKILVEFEFYHDYSGRQRTYLDEQTWVYKAASASWSLTSGLPAFGVSPRQ